MAKPIRSFALVLLLCTAFTLPILGVLNHDVISSYSIDLDFKGSTAHCTIEILAIKTDTELIATILLQKQNAYGRYDTVESWKETGTGSLAFYDTYTNAEPGQYRLKVDIEAIATNGNDSFSEAMTAILLENN